MDEQNAIQKRRIILPNFSERILSFLTFAIYIITMLIFEIGYCNASNIVNIVNRNFNEITYNFSLCRLIMYIVILILVGVFRKRFVNDTIETLEKNKYKKIFTYLYLFLGVLTIIVASIIVAKFPLLYRGMSIGMMAVLMGAIVAIYISNNILKNVIIITLNLGMIFSISTNFNHAIDEKKHFMTAFNIAFGNFDYVENPITDSGIEQLPQISKFSTINPFLEKKYEPNITNEVNKVNTEAYVIEEDQNTGSNNNNNNNQGSNNNNNNNNNINVAKPGSVNTSPINSSLDDDYKNKHDENDYKQDGEQAAKDGNNADNVTKAFDNWRKVCQSVITAKMTAQQAIAKDYMGIIRAHVRSYVGRADNQEDNEQAGKPTNYAKNNKQQNNNQNK